MIYLSYDLTLLDREERRGGWFHDEPHLRRAAADWLRTMPQVASVCCYDRARVAMVVLTRDADGIREVACGTCSGS